MHEIKVIAVFGHYEAYIDDQFIASGDTYREAYEPSFVCVRGSRRAFRGGGNGNQDSLNRGGSILLL